MSDQTWVIGSSQTCDLLIDQPTVSAYHCVLMRKDDNYFLSDCGSTNGTFCDSRPIEQKLQVYPGSHVTLGHSLRLPWPTIAGARQVVTIGRDPSNDLILDHRNVSSLHARLILGFAKTYVLEDLGSRNGVSVIVRGVRCRIRRAVAVEPDQVVYIADHAVEVSKLLEIALAKTPRPAPSPAPRGGTIATEPITRIPSTGGAFFSETQPTTIVPSSGERATQYVLWFFLGFLASIALYLLVGLLGTELKQKSWDWSLPVERFD